MEENKIESGNKLIAEFDSAHKDMYGKWFDSTGKFMGYDDSELMYHKNWQWQIPVYSKLAKMMKEKATDNNENHERYFRMLEKYESGVFNNDPLKGFEIIIENLNWLNKIK